MTNGPLSKRNAMPLFGPDVGTKNKDDEHHRERQAPGRRPARARSPGVFGQESTYASWWPEGNRVTEDNPSTPLQSTVVITRE